MNRRILLVDADPGFQQTLTDAVRRFRFDVHVELNPEQAYALASADPPVVLIIGVEEPDKAGFKLFQRCKKGALGKVPIMLITESVPPDSFAKHRNLKAHADAYLDKRAYSVDELLGKIDGMEALGEPIMDQTVLGVGIGITDDLDIPVEVDDIAMADDGDLVLEEEVAVDDDLGAEFGTEFGEDPHAAMAPFAEHAQDAGPAHAEPVAAPPVDALVDEDIENAFGGLLGDDFGGSGDETQAEGRPTGLPTGVAPAVAVIADGVPERVGGGTIPPPYAAALQDAVPAELDDHTAFEEAVPNLDAEDEPVPAPIDEEGDSFVDGDSFHAEDARPPLEASVEEAPVEEAPSSGSLPVLDGPPLELPVTPLEAAPPVDEDDLPVEVEAPEDDLPIAVEQAAEHLPVAPPRLESQPAIALDADDLIEEDIEPELTPAPPAPVEPPRAKRPSVKNVVDLGLEALAQDADREQSGVFDRRELRKVAELEHQVKELRAELERVRASAGSAQGGTSRQGEFLKLRENLLTQATELKRAQVELEARDKELATATERLEAARQAVGSLEAQVADLDKRAATEGTRAQTVEARERAVSTQLAGVQQELTTRTQAYEAAESARAQLERDLATERALRASNASEAESALRVEREEMVARHQSELAALRGEAAAQQEAALAALRGQLEQQHAEAIAAATSAAMQDAGRDAGEARRQLEAAHVAELEQREATHAKALVRAEVERDAALKRAKLELDATSAQLETAHAAAAAELRAEIERAQGDTAELRAQLDAAKQAAAQAAGSADAAAGELRGRLATADAEITELRAELDATKRAAEDTIIDLRAQVDATRREAAQHAAAVTAAEQTGAKAVADQAAQHERALADQIAQHAAALAAAEQAHAAALASTEQTHAVALAAGDQASAQALADQAAQHERALASAEQARAAALASAQQAHADALATAEQAGATALADQAAQHERALAEHTTRHTAALAELSATHEQALADHTAQHAAALAGAEHARTAELADQAAQHERALAEQHAAVSDALAERDELKQGLSSARDAHRRTEAELATAVSTIADRNAELRTLTQAITDRDQRIADLRKELEALEQENASYQEQVLRAYQKIKTDEAMVTRAKKAMAIALTVLDDPGQPKES